jgi:hypothetical protein
MLHIIRINSDAATAPAAAAVSTSAAFRMDAPIAGQGYCFNQDASSGSSTGPAPAGNTISGNFAIYDKQAVHK